MSNEVKNSIDNSELIEYLKIRKDAQTEVEIKNIMSKIYEIIATASNLFYAFDSSIPPQIDENGNEIFDPNAIIKPALIYSDKAEPYLPVYTTVEESMNRGNVEQFPYIKQAPFEQIVILEEEYPEIQGLVLNPFTDNMIISNSKIRHLIDMKIMYLSKNLEDDIFQETQSENNDNSSNSNNNDDNENDGNSNNDNNNNDNNNNDSTNSKHKMISNVIKDYNPGAYKKVDGSVSDIKRKKKILINEYDLRILEYNVLPVRIIKVALEFAKENPSISAMWIFDKRYYLPNNNIQYLAQLIVIEDDLQNEEEKERLYANLRDVILPQSNANEVFVESIEKQKDDFVRKNGILPFYQRVNLF